MNCTVFVVRTNGELDKGKTIKNKVICHGFKWVKEPGFQLSMGVKERKNICSINSPSVQTKLKFSIRFRLINNESEESRIRFGGIREKKPDVFT